VQELIFSAQIGNNRLLAGLYCYVMILAKTRR